MKAKYLILFLILVLVFNFGLACSSSEPEEKIIEEEKSLITKTIPKTIDVKYVVIGHIINKWGGISDPKVSVTYNNTQGGTQQTNNLILEKDFDTVFADLITPLDLEGDDEKYWIGEIIAHYDSFPKDEFLYISAQNKYDYGTIVVFIIVNNRIWKSSTSEGEYCIASANGYYDK